MKTILVVDDDKVSLSTAKNVLNSDNDYYKVIIVKSGMQALTYLEKNNCDLILLDVNMPEMDGFETLDAIRKTERGRNLPIIFLTSDTEVTTVTRCYESGAVDFIEKPFVPIVLRTRVAIILELWDLRKAVG